MPDIEKTISPEADEALAVIRAICGGDQYAEIVQKNENWIEVETFCTDDINMGGRRRITIGIDGRLMGDV